MIDLKDGAAKFKLKHVFVMIDFESAVIDTYKMHFHEIERKPCHFNLVNIHKKVCEKWKELLKRSEEKLNSYIKQMTAF
jgi:hypothetical protein